MIFIQRGDPPPRRSRNKYPFADMDVGDWFFLPDPPPSFRSHLSVMRKTLGWDFQSFTTYMRKIDQHVDTSDRWEGCAQSDDGAMMGVVVRRTK